MNKYNNKWSHGITNLVLPPLPASFMNETGIFYKTLVLDKNVGEEIVLMIFDSTDFIHELRRLKPFRFFISSIAVNTSFGPVFSFLFWVSQPHDERLSFAIFDKPLDISQPQSIEPWAQLANQTHVHLLLIDKNYLVQGFYEFENSYAIGEAVETIAQLDAGRVVNFDMAEQEYFDKYSLEQLYEMLKDNIK